MDAPPSPTQQHKVLVLLLLVAALLVVVVGAFFFVGAPQCAQTSPIIYTWSLAALLLYAAFGGLVLAVPLLAVIFPFLAVALVPVIAVLVSVASWLSDAGKRSAFGAATTLQRWFQLGGVGFDAPDAQPTPMTPLVANPASTFPLYVNSAALVWLFVFLLVEVQRSWELKCDAPLHLFVLIVGLGGLLLTMLSFVLSVFQDPMPPITKLEQSRARDERLRRLYTYGWIVVAGLLWCGWGCFSFVSSETCGTTAPAIYRLAALVCFVYVMLTSVLVLAVACLGIDACLAGKLRMVVVLEQ
jgi:hypothetical protein